jgi:hypothetical protein
LKKDGLTGDDLLATYVGRRVSPLQCRPHKMCFMSDHRDPCRISTVELDHGQILRRIKAVAKTQMKEDWTWGKAPHDRANPAPKVNLTSLSDISFMPAIPLLRYCLPDIPMVSA